MASPEPRASLIQELTRVQEQEGWLSDASLGALARRLGMPLHRLQSVSTFYTHFRRTPPPLHEVEACCDLPCALAGGRSALARARAELGSSPEVEIREVSCLGRCDRAPAARVGGALVDLGEPAALRAALRGQSAPGAAVRSGPWAAEVYAREDQRYTTLRAALGRPPQELSAALEAAGLRGMGGAGFPTGRKWALVAAEPAVPRYVICNADESEPGTFKDRQILSDLPHLVIEGMALGGYCVGARRGWIFLRHEYEPERACIEAELARARAAGALGERIWGSDFDFDIEIFVSPGGYILGEETALLECMEDRRGEPRNKPPFPGTRGLWGQPTLINNVETFAHATGILRNGPEWWRGLGVRGCAGHKFIGVSGDVARPQVALVPMGTTLRELLERCGGMKGGAAPAAVAPGGASSAFLGPEQLDRPISFEELAEAGSMLGSGAAVFVAQGRDLLEVGLNVARFFARESCGKCVPCRVGSRKAIELLERDGDSPATRARLEELHQVMFQTSLCGLGQVALAPLLSLLRRSPPP